jgi:hypothetical protein
VKAGNRHALSASFTSHKRIDLFEALLTELKIAEPKNARQVDTHLLRNFGRPTAAVRAQDENGSSRLVSQRWFCFFSIAGCGYAMRLR